MAQTNVNWNRNIMRDIERNIAELNTLTDDLTKGRQKALLRPIARKVVAAIQANAPTDTGNLLESIRILPFKKTKNMFVGPHIVKGLGSGSGKYAKGNKYVGGWYAHFQEFGTQNGIEAQHFVQKTMDAQGPMFVAELQKAIQRALKRRAKKING